MLQGPRTFTALINLASKICLLAAMNDTQALAAIAPKLREFVRSNGYLTSVDVHPLHGGLSMEVWIRYRPNKYPTPTKPRLFDLLIVVAMLMMERAGGKFCFHPTTSNGKRYLNPRFEHRSDQGAEARVYFTRAIYDAPDGSRIPHASDYHSCRLADLMKMVADKRLPAPKLGRAKTIKLARRIFEETHPTGLEGITADEFEKVLTRVFEVATEFHGNRG